MLSAPFVGCCKAAQLYRSRSVSEPAWVGLNPHPAHIKKAVSRRGRSSLLMTTRAYQDTRNHANLRASGCCLILKCNDQAAKSADVGLVLLAWMAACSQQADILVPSANTGSRPEPVGHQRQLPGAVNSRANARRR